MTKLVISVRGAEEAGVALAAGADLIDVKEPRKGPLGRAERATIEQVIRRVDGRVPVSAALGELIDWPIRSDREQHARCDPLPGGLTWAKFGMAGCANAGDWEGRWQGALRQLPAGVNPVAVIYADDRAAGAPRPRDILETGVRFGCRAVLVDTFDKSGGGLLDHWSPGDVRGLIEQGRRAAVLVVLAGSLDLRSIRTLLPLRPDYFAVRGAACDGDRAAAISAARVRALAKLVGSSHAHKTAVRN